VKIGRRDVPTERGVVIEVVSRKQSVILADRFLTRCLHERLKTLSTSPVKAGLRLHVTLTSTISARSLNFVGVP
jgi:hypothetical protein